MLTSIIKNICRIVFLVCVCACTNYSHRSEISDAVIDCFYNQQHLLIVSKKGNLIIDTGANVSWLFGDKIKLSSVVCDSATVNKEQKLPMHKVDSLIIGNLKIKDYSFIITNSDAVSFGADSSTIGIIGMDILSHKYCYFDIQNNTLTLSSERKNQNSPTLVFHYKLQREMPFSNVQINGKIFEDVLFDMGFAGFLKLMEEDTGKLSKHTDFQKDVNYDIFGNDYAVLSENLDSLFIEDICFQNRKVKYGQHHYRLLGMEFAKQWSSFLIDPFERKIEFYL